MDKDIFHYLGKRPLKVSTELRDQPQQPELAPETIELPAAGTTGIGYNLPDTTPAETGWAIAAADHPVVLTGEAFEELPSTPETDAGFTEAAATEVASAPTAEGFTMAEAPEAVPDAFEAAPPASYAWEPANPLQAFSAATLPWRNNPLVMAMAVAFIAIYVARNAGGFTDNDIWFILATGREILENGIPYSNPFAMHADMGIVVQQWVPCVIAYGLYSLGGFVALGLWVGLLSALVVLSLYRLGRLVKGDRFGGEWILLAIAVAVPALLGYLSMRPHAYTMLAFCWLLFFLEKHRRSGKPGWLSGCVVLVAAHVNFQMALAPFDLVIIACYCIPNVLAPLHKRGRLLGVQLSLGSYKRWPVALCLALAAIALLANPYGLDGALYLVDSYGTAGYKNYISEMGVLAPWGMGFGGMAAVVMLVLASMAAGKRGLRGIDLPLTLLAFGVGLAAFTHTRNIWLIAFFALPLVMSATHGWSMDFAKLPLRTRRKKRKGDPANPAMPTDLLLDPQLTDPAFIEQKLRRRRNVAWGCTAAICLGAAIATGVLLWQAVPQWNNYEKESDLTPSGLLDYLEKKGVDPKDVRLFNSFNIGGYLEWRGYTVFMDPRPELWSPAISGHSTDYYREYTDMLVNDDWTDRDYAAFLDKYDFDYLIVENGTKIATYLKDFSTDYMSLLGTGDYTLWGRKGEPGTNAGAEASTNANAGSSNGTGNTSNAAANASNAAAAA